MNTHTSRRHFLKGNLLVAAGLILPALNAKPLNKSNMQDKLPPLNSDLVKDFVANCHGNFEKVKELYQKEPKLIFSSHDWQNGDFESGIEAAGHTGHKEIAHFLLEKGARINFFTLCMLGDIKIVKQMLETYPYLLNAKGPHGFTPLHHAIQGKEDAEAVRQHLVSLGAVETQIKL